MANLLEHVLFPKFTKFWFEESVGIALGQQHEAHSFWSKAPSATSELERKPTKLGQLARMGTWWYLVYVVAARLLLSHADAADKHFSRRAVTISVNVTPSVLKYLTPLTF